jgi:hypothetical protein
MKKILERVHRLNRRTLIYRNADFYDHYDLRRGDGTPGTQIELIFIDFFPCGKSWNAQAPYCQFAIRYSLLFERRFL